MKRVMELAETLTLEIESELNNGQLSMGTQRCLETFRAVLVKHREYLADSCFADAVFCGDLTMRLELRSILNLCPQSPEPH